MPLKIIKYLFNLAGIATMIFLTIREYGNVTKLADCCLLKDLKDAQKESLLPIFIVYMIVVICGNWAFERNIEEENKPKEFLLISIGQLLGLVLIIFAQIVYVKFIDK